MVADPKTFFTQQEYLELERPAPWKSEYYRGQIMPMPHPDITHVRLVINLMCALHTELRGSLYDVFASQLRIYVEAADFFAYPDVLIALPPLELSAYDEDTLTNPMVIAEVISPSTAAFDRGAKSQHYRHIPSLRDYLMVEQDAMHIEYFARQDDDAWLLREYSAPDDVVELASVDCRLKLSEVYERVEFPE